MHRAPAAAEHVVQFYDNDAAVCRALADFVAEGADRRERVIALVSAAHWSTVRALLLATRRLDLDRAGDDIIFHDSAIVLDRITVDGRVDTAAFSRLLGGALAGSPGRLRVYGDVVSILAGRGLLDAAIALEALGHELAHTHGAQVLCAYDVRAMRPGADDVKQTIAARHDRAIDGMQGVRPAGPTILLADDYEDARDLYRYHLELCGYDVVTATDGADAVAKAQQCQPAVILLDIRMPRVSGIEAMEQLKQDPRFAGVPMVALTAHALSAERDMFLSKGFDAVVAKPCLPRDLAQIVESLVAAKRA